jgi:hypothetical protein
MIGLQPHLICPGFITLSLVFVLIDAKPVSLTLRIESSICLVIHTKDKFRIKLKPTKLLILGMSSHYWGLTIRLRTALTKLSTSATTSIQ